MTASPMVAEDGVDVARHASIVTAARTVLRARRAAEAAAEAKTAALVALWESGVPKTQVWQVAQQQLRDAGFTEADIADVALSAGTVRVLLDRVHVRRR